MKTLEDLKQAQDIIQMKPKKNARRNNTKNMEYWITTTIGASTTTIGASRATVGATLLRRQTITVLPQSQQSNSQSFIEKCQNLTAKTDYCSPTTK